MQVWVRRVLVLCTIWPLSAVPAVASAEPPTPIPPRASASPVESIPVPTLVAAVDETTTWVAMDYGRYVLRTTSSGRTWERIDLPKDIVGLQEWVVLDAESVWLVGAVPDLPSSVPPSPPQQNACGGVPPPPCHAGIFYTGDGARTWTEIGREPFVRQARA